MKCILFPILFCICSAQNSYPIETECEAEENINFYDGDKSREYIIYEFGFSKINSVYIVKDDTCFDVYISDGNTINFLTICKKSPILNWAFEKAPDEFASAQFVTDKEYKPFYYKLTIMVDNVPIIIDSSSMRIKELGGNIEKIDELKRFIISLWKDTIDVENYD